MNLIEKAIEYAAIAHEGQYRKGTETPYISHPYAVGMILMSYRCSEEVIVAGILHDTIEDTATSLTDIQTEFGDEIAVLVAGASEPDKSVSWEDRKAHTIDFIKTAPLHMRHVICADKLHNARSILLDYRVVGDDIWRRFKRGRDDQKWYYTSIVESLKVSDSFPMVEELWCVVNELFRIET